jgi:hypothetical protein
MMLRQTWSLTLQNSMKNTLKPGVTHSDPEPQKPIKGADMADGSISKVDDTDTITVPVEDGGGGDKDPPVETKTDEDEPALRPIKKKPVQDQAVVAVTDPAPDKALQEAQARFEAAESARKAAEATANAERQRAEQAERDRQRLLREQEQLAERTSTELKVVTAVPTSETASTSEQPDEFDLESLRLSQSFTETAGVKKLLTTVPVRKPNRHEFVRVHPSADYRADFAMIVLKEEREEEYIVCGRDLIGELAGEITPKTLYTAINRQGVVFLWPVRLPDSDGREMEWHRSMREAAELGMKQWVRVKANMSLGAYEITVAASAIAEPTWPEVKFKELVKIGLRGHLITTIDHPVIKGLWGL